MADGKDRLPQEPEEAREPVAYASPVKRAWAWVGIVYMLMFVAGFTWYLATARFLIGTGPLLLCPAFPVQRSRFRRLSRISALSLLSDTPGMVGSALKYSRKLRISPRSEMERYRSVSGLLLEKRICRPKHTSISTCSGTSINLPSIQWTLPPHRAESRSRLISIRRSSGRSGLTRDSGNSRILPSLKKAATPFLVKKL